MSVASAERLHVIAHRALIAGRDFDDWWGSAIETAFAAVVLARHTRGYREDALRALVRIERWWTAGEMGRTSADAAAMALAARAAADLQRLNVELLAAAAGAVDDIVRRSPPVAPELHVALGTWALDGLVVDRAIAPWPALRARPAAPLAGVNMPLRAWTDAVSQAEFNPNKLVQDILSTIGLSPGGPESCVTIWLLGISLEKLSLSLPSGDNALQLLARRRTELVERAATIIDERTFNEPGVPDIHDDLGAGEKLPTYLTSFEAALLDAGLAPQDEAVPWLRFDEAVALFGEREAAARSAAKALRRRLFAAIAGLAAVLGLLGGTTVWFGCRWLGVQNGVAVGLSTGVGAAAFVAAALMWHRSNPGGARLAEPAGVFFALCSILAIVGVINQVRDRPIVSAYGDLVGGVVVSALGAFVWAALSYRRPGRRSDDKP